MLAQRYAIDLQQLGPGRRSTPPAGHARSSPANPADFSERDHMNQPHNNDARGKDRAPRSANRPLTLSYGRALYDWWGQHRVLYRLACVPVFLGREGELRQLAVDGLELVRGATVLDVACGHGVNFPLLQRAIGSTGTLIGLDYSEEMLAAAKCKVEEAGWANVGLRQADAAHVELGEHVLDGALCTLGLSAMPNRELAIANIHRALKPRSRFVVLDIPPFEGIARVFNPIVKPVYKYTANWRPHTDLAADLRQAFGEVVVQTFNARTLLLAVATKQ